MIISYSNGYFFLQKIKNLQTTLLQVLIAWSYVVGLAQKVYKPERTIASIWHKNLVNVRWISFQETHGTKFSYPLIFVTSK